MFWPSFCHLLICFYLAEAKPILTIQKEYTVLQVHYKERNQCEVSRTNSPYNNISRCRFIIGVLHFTTNVIYFSYKCEISIFSLIVVTQTVIYCSIILWTQCRSTNSVSQKVVTIFPIVWAYFLQIKIWKQKFQIPLLKKIRTWMVFQALFITSGIIP